jgi:hypothetical protein
MYWVVRGEAETRPGTSPQRRQSPSPVMTKKNDKMYLVISLILIFLHLTEKEAKRKIKYLYHR